MRANWFEWRHASLEDRDRCRALIKGGSRSFFAASLLLPTDLRHPAYAVYAFCRLADDGVDLSASPEAALKDQHQRLDAIYAGEPLDHPSDRALTDVVQNHHLPRPLFDALLEGLAWDEMGHHTYESIEDLHAYAARVASAVGTIMTCLMGRRNPQTLARACDLGVAMQLTNIARDVGEDARNGRVYLPHAWLRQDGLMAADLIKDPQMSPALGRVIKRLLDHADTLYAQSASGIAGLPRRCRPAINAARRIYREIGEVIRDQGYDSVTVRAVVPTWRKVQLAVLSAGEAYTLRDHLENPSLDETRFLVEAVEAHTDAIRGTGPQPQSPVEWIIAMLGTLEERERQRNHPLSEA